MQSGVRLQITALCYSPRAAIGQARAAAHNRKIEPMVQCRGGTSPHRLAPPDFGSQLRNVGDNPAQTVARAGITIGCVGMVIKPNQIDIFDYFVRLAALDVLEG